MFFKTKSAHPVATAHREKRVKVRSLRWVRMPARSASDFCSRRFSALMTCRGPRCVHVLRSIGGVYTCVCCIHACTRNSAAAPTK